MGTRGKNYVNAAKKATTETMSMSEAVAQVKKQAYGNFKGSIELHLDVKLPKDKDAKSIKGSFSLPHSFGTSDVKIAVFTNEGNEKAAAEAGADFSTMSELVKDVKAGKINFEVAIATPDVMPQIAALGKQLGPKGLMPNPKTGTVTEDFAGAIKEYKQGKMNFKCDEQGGVHLKIAALEMDDSQVIENINFALEEVASVIGKKVNQLYNGMVLAPTMGKSVRFEMDSEE